MAALGPLASIRGIPFESKRNKERETYGDGATKKQENRNKIFNNNNKIIIKNRTRNKYDGAVASHPTPSLFEPPMARQAQRG